jgi:hypothetical protein
MTQLKWRERLHAFFAGRLVGKEFHADEGYVTQMLELGQTEAVEEYEQTLNHVIIHG